MNKPGSLDYQVNRLGFWSAVVAVITSVVAMLLPLDAPEAKERGTKREKKDLGQRDPQSLTERRPRGTKRQNEVQKYVLKTIYKAFACIADGAPGARTFASAVLDMAYVCVLVPVLTLFQSPFKIM